MMQRFKRLVCCFIGHRWDVEGITGKYQWCSRCAERRTVVDLRDKTPE